MSKAVLTLVSERWTAVYTLVHVVKSCFCASPAGLVTGEDYEEARHSRGGRGGRSHGGQKSWRYSRWVWISRAVFIGCQQVARICGKCGDVDAVMCLVTGLQTSHWVLWLSNEREEGLEVFEGFIMQIPVVVNVQYFLSHAAHSVCACIGVGLQPSNFWFCSRSIVHAINSNNHSYREEEDREVAAAMRASMEMHRHEDRGAAQERSAPKHNREERTERPEPEEPRHRTGNIKPASKPPGDKLWC